MGVRHEKRKNDDKSDEPSDKKHRADMMNMETTVDIAEVFSPPRITAVAQRIGLRSGCNLDLTTHDTDGKPWDFDSKEMRNRAILKVVAEKPYVLITSPMCVVFSIMMNADGKKLGPAEKQRRMNRARMHLKFACTLHLLQHSAGRYFVHAHPRSASSWAEQCVIDVVRMTGALFTTLDQCMFGLMSTSDDGVNLPSKKATTLISNMPAIQTYMARRCDGTAFVHSQKFCFEIAMAVKKERRSGTTRGSSRLRTSTTSTNRRSTTRRTNSKFPHEESDYDDHNDNTEEAWDDVSGKHLDPEGVRKARAAEIDCYRKMGVYVKSAHRRMHRQGNDQSACVDSTSTRAIAIAPTTARVWWPSSTDRSGTTTCTQPRHQSSR